MLTLNANASVTATFSYAGSTWPAGGSLPAGWTGSGGGWSVVSGSPGVDTYEGGYALKSNPIANSASASISYTASFAAGTVSFARRVSSETDYDFLFFYIDGVLQGYWSGTVPWAMESFAIAAGTHTLRWTYEKDISVAQGLDAAWIDAITLPPLTALLTVSKGGVGGQRRDALGDGESRFDV
jgi:hypothetical protein